MCNRFIIFGFLCHSYYSYHYRFIYSFEWLYTEHGGMSWDGCWSVIRPALKWSAVDSFSHWDSLRISGSRVSGVSFQMIGYSKLGVCCVCCVRISEPSGGRETRADPVSYWHARISRGRLAHHIQRWRRFMSNYLNMTDRWNCPRRKSVGLRSECVCSL